MSASEASASSRSLPANVFHPTVNNLADPLGELPPAYQAHVYKNDPALTLGTIVLGVVLVVLLSCLIYWVQRPSPHMAASAPLEAQATASHP